MGQDSLDTQVSDLYYETRKVTAGGALVCIVGTQRDSHDFAAQAVKKGAGVLIIQHSIPLEGLEKITVVQVPSSRKALALMSANYFGRPAEKLTMIGVTGTKGKTTTTHMIKSVLDAAGRQV